MQVLHFGGKLQAKNSGGAMFDIGIKYTIDLISRDRISENTIILQQKLDSDTQAQRDAHEEYFGASFRVNERYTVADFKTFATANGLRLAITDSDGSNHETLVANDSSSSL
jgi:hypothetical protein